MKYAKGIVVVEAKQITDIDSVHEILKWTGKGEVFSDLCMQIKNLKGYMTAFKYDWVIKGVFGEFYSCDPLVFERTYRKIGESDILLALPFSSSSVLLRSEKGH